MQIWHSKSGPNCLGQLKLWLGKDISKQHPVNFIPGGFISLAGFTFKGVQLTSAMYNIFIVEILTKKINTYTFGYFIHKTIKWID